MVTSNHVATGSVCLLVLVSALSILDNLLPASWMDAVTKGMSVRGAGPSGLTPWLETLSSLSWLAYLQVMAGLGMIYLFYLVQLRPMDRVRQLEDIGYIREGALSLKDTANLIQKRRKVGNIPPAFPNGWFGLLESVQLRAGEAKTVSALGENFAIFRDESGQAHVLNAYCPHMGANLAVGGRVIADCLQCPFHAWTFRGSDGKCVGIPYTDKIPDIARVKSWPVREVSGWIFVWYHAEGVEPTWSIPVVEELEKRSWVYRGRTEHYVSAHIEEISENGADVVHLQQVHAPIILAGTDLRAIWNKFWTFARHTWTAAWQARPEPEAHVGFLKLTHDVSIGGFLLPLFGFVVSTSQIGPGLVYLEFQCFFGRGMFIQVVTPQGPLLQKVVHHMYSSPWMPAFMAKIYLLGEAIQVERDIMIWNNKQYEARPMFVKSREDTLIAKHRRWFSQFYSDTGRRFLQKEDLSF